MPVLSEVPGTPEGPQCRPGSQVFWDVCEITSFARAACNDMQLSEAGDLLADDQPYTQWLLNLCYANLQDELQDSGIAPKEWIIAGIPASPANDPAQRVSLSYQGYFDGVNVRTGPWELPMDLLVPLHLWERPAGSLSPFVPMCEKLGGFPSRPSGSCFGIWEFSETETCIWLPICGQATDLRIRGTPSLGKLYLPLGANLPMQVPLARCGQALAYMIAAEFAESRGDDAAQALRLKANQQVQKMQARTAKKMQQAKIRRQPYGRGLWRRRG